MSAADSIPSLLIELKSPAPAEEAEPAVLADWCPSQASHIVGLVHVLKPLLSVASNTTYGGSLVLLKPFDRDTCSSP